MVVVLVGAGLAAVGCVRQPVPPAPTPPPTPSNTPVVAVSPTPPEAMGWDVAIDLGRCQPGERRLGAHGLGSNSITVKGTAEGNTCFLEYTIEVEGGYTIYDCRVPAVSAPLSPAQLDVSKFCQPARTGNVFLDMDTPSPE